VPAAVAVHDSVAVFGLGGSTMLAGSVQVSPAGVDGDTERVTVPANPFCPVTVMVAVPVPPASIWLGETALADIAKSTTWNSMLAVVWDSVPLFPVTVTV
jgi:hypothetical protein